MRLAVLIALALTLAACQRSAVWDSLMDGTPIVGPPLPVDVRVVR